MTTGMQQAVDPPTVTGTPAISGAGEDGRWGPGETVEVSLTFSEAVEVEPSGGTPDIGIGLELSEARRAAYASGSATDTLVFAYTLDKDDGNRSSMGVTPNSLTLNGGSIRSVATGVDAVLDHNGAAVQGSAGRTPTGPTARFSSLPGNHGGSPFTFGVSFSAEPERLSYRTVRGGLLNVEGGAVTKAVRSTPGSNQGWRVTVAPSGSDDVRIELPNRACGEANAICIGGQALSRAVSATVAHGEEEVAVVALTATFSSAPDEHDGGEAFELEFRLSEEPGGMSFRTVQNGLFTVTGGSITRAWRLTAGENREWGLKITPSGLGAVKLVVNATTDCGQSPGVCTDDGRMLAGGATTTIQGPPTLSVAEAEVDEGPDAALSFTVTLSRALSDTVTVRYATSDGTARAGDDYTATSGTLAFAAQETSRSVSVPVADDGHDEGAETVTLTLSSPSPSRVKLADATATGTINNHDPMPKAWMVRFGRTVGSQVVDALQARLEGDSGHVTVGGVRLGVDALRSLNEDAVLGERGRDAEQRAALRTMSADETLRASAFHLSSGDTSAGGVAFSAWGRISTGGFEANVNDVTLDGDVTTALFGADAQWEQVLAGLMVSQSAGDGDYRLAEAMGDDAGQVESALTGVYPYASLALGERIRVWGIAGIGSGDLTLARSSGETLETDLSMRMGAAGVSGALLHGSGPTGLALNADALWVGMESDAIEGLVATQGDTTRARLTLDAERAFAFGEGAVLTPSAQLGVRIDGGDAETGAGVEAGAGLAWRAGPFSIEGRLRGLLAHEDRGYEEWGASATLRLLPSASGRGLSLSVAPTWGNASDATQRLWGAQDARAFAPYSAEAHATRRLDAELGYGVALSHARGLLTPYAGATLSGDGARTLRGGARWALSEQATLALEGQRSTESAALGVRGNLRF